MPLQVGEPAPDFNLTDAHGNLVSLSDFRGKRVILYFYPRDNTPGCTTEACNFRDAYDKFQTQGMVVLGVSTDNQTSHAKFITKYDLPFPLLSDPDGTLSQHYGSYGLKKMMGKEYNGIYRNTFVIDTNGIIEKIYLNVKPSVHIAQILKDLGLE
ncbi:MAG: thioredoxin-dependent thiol peroxidase [Synechococcales bacterium]|nr:thioredoxin-dependent thiol peroxidase [Synechococcales bacterium]